MLTNYINSQQIGINKWNLSKLLNIKSDKTAKTKDMQVTSVYKLQ